MTVVMDRNDTNFLNNSNRKELETQQYIENLLAAMQDSAIPQQNINSNFISQAHNMNQFVFPNTNVTFPTALDVRQRFQIVEESMEELLLEGQQKFNTQQTPLIISPSASSLSPHWQSNIPTTIAPTTPLIISSTGTTPLMQSSSIKDAVPPLSLDNSPQSATSNTSSSTSTQSSLPAISANPQQLIQTVTSKCQQKFEPSQQSSAPSANSQDFEANSYVKAMFQWAYNNNSTKSLRESIRAANSLVPATIINTAPPRTHRARKEKKEVEEQQQLQPTSSSDVKKKRAARRNSTGNIMDALHSPTPMIQHTTTTSTAPTQHMPFISVMPPVSSSTLQPPPSHTFNSTTLDFLLNQQGTPDAVKALAAMHKLKKPYSFTEVTSQSLKHKADKDRQRKEAKRRKQYTDTDSPGSDDQTETPSSSSSSKMNQSSSSTPMTIVNEEQMPSSFVESYHRMEPMTDVTPPSGSSSSMTQSSTEQLYGGFIQSNPSKSKKPKNYEAFMTDWRM